MAAVSDVQGDWDSLASIAKAQAAGIILHTGNFGFWNSGTVQRGTDLNYLKQIVAFLAVLPRKLVEELNDLSVINGSRSAGSGETLAEKPPGEEFQLALMECGVLSNMDEYLQGTKTFEVPVYTVVGPLDDPYIVAKFLSGEFSVPNLYIIDHHQAYTILTEGDQPNIRLYGIGGNLKVHSLFDSGALDGRLSGRAGDLWITMDQVAQLYLNAQKQEPEAPAVNIFMSHLPVVKTPLLEHLAIVTGADITVSQGLHFRYPVLGNGMSFVDSMGGSAGYIENYRSKFSRLRMILGEMWVVIKSEVGRLLEDDPQLRQLIELGLSLFDKIPVTISDSTAKIVKLSLEDVDEDDEENAEISKLTLKRINDMYFSAYHKLWHFNLCDHWIPFEDDDDDEEDDDINVDDDDDDDDDDEYNVMVFSLTRRGYFKLVHCNSPGFNFKSLRTSDDQYLRDGPVFGEGSAKQGDDADSKTGDHDLRDVGDDGIRRTKDLLNSTYKDYRARGRGGRGRGGRARDTTSKRGRGSR